MSTINYSVMTTFTAAAPPLIYRLSDNLQQWVRPLQTRFKPWSCGQVELTRNIPSQQIGERRGGFLGQRGLHTRALFSPSSSPHQPLHPPLSSLLYSLIIILWASSLSCRYGILDSPTSSSPNSCSCGVWRAARFTSPAGHSWQVAWCSGPRLRGTGRNYQDSRLRLGVWPLASRGGLTENNLKKTLRFLPWHFHFLHGLPFQLANCHILGRWRIVRGAFFPLLLAHGIRSVRCGCRH